MQVEYRNDLPKLIDEMNLKIGVEVGVEKGQFSEILLTSKLDKLYSIDLWTEQDGTYQDINNLSNRQHAENKKETEGRLEKYGERSVIVKCDSTEASKLIANESLDFVYIDANHSYEACLSDIKIWYPKLRVGGIIAGHDYIPDGIYPEGVFGVQRAVNEYFKDKIINTTKDAWASWWTTKI